MSTEILSKKDAKIQMKKLGILVSEKLITVGRFFVVENPNDKSVKISPFSVVGDGVNGFGVSFVYYYRGILTDNKSINYVLSCISFLLPRRWKNEYALYVRAFEGKNSRFPSVVLKRHSAIVNYDMVGHSFRAAGGEWFVDNGVLRSFETRKNRLMSPI